MVVVGVSLIERAGSGSQIVNQYSETISTRQNIEPELI